MARPNEMFQYLYWPDDWPAEAASQLRRAQAQVQLLLQAADFDLVEEELFRLANKGVYLEICIREHAADRDLRYVNAKKRLVLAGAIIAVVPIHSYQDENECYLVVDRRHIISSARYDGHDDNRSIIVDRTRHFQSLMSLGHVEDPAVDDLHIRLWSSTHEASPGQSVDIHWDVRNADFIDMEPGIGAVNPSGSLSVGIFEDTLFRIKAGNRNAMLMRSLVVRIAEPSRFEVTLSVLDEGTGLHIPLEPATATARTYAVLRGDLVRLAWRAPSNTELHERRIGALPLEGKHELEVSEDEIFVFTLRTPQGEIETSLSVMAVDEPSYLPQASPAAGTSTDPGRLPDRGWLTGLAGRILGLLRK